MSSIDTTQGGGVKHYILTATLDSSMVPGTQVRVDVLISESIAH
jgi:hypothetical protein